MLRIIAVFALSFLFILPQGSVAQSISVKAKKFKQQRFVQFEIFSSETIDDCDVRLYASANRKFLSGDYARARFLGSVSLNTATQTVLAKKVPLAANSLSKTERRIYVRAVADCADFVGASKTRAFLIPVSNKGTGVRSGDKWIRKVAKKILTSSIALVNAFPELTFSRPVDLQSPGSHSRVLYVVGQEGIIYAIDTASDTPSQSIFLDIQSKNSYNTGEQGLLGLAFHPNVQNNREFFVYYTEAGTDNTVVARYRISEANELVAETAEERILEVVQPSKNHNGGSLAFGKDGYLYISLGDGGGAGDPFSNGQDRSTLLGSILRIDVDNTEGSLNYAIPSDNPFASNGNNFREEIFAYGLRNPWRMSFDSSSGTLWVGDVGQGSFEEVNVIKSGSNYGWNTMEGQICFGSSTCDRTGLTLPVVDYGRTLGQSIVGGYVYRGELARRIKGFYVYADYLTGRIWGVKRLGKKAVWTQLLDTELFIPAFGTNALNELYVLGFDGSIYTMAPA